MRVWGGAVAIAGLLLAGGAHGEVLCVRAKKDGTLSGAIKVRTECKRREVQVDAPMLGLCCDPFTTTTTSTTTTSDTGFGTTLPPPTSSTSSTAPQGSTSTTVPGASTTTSSSAPTTSSTVTTSSTATTSSTVTTTTLTCPTITTTTIVLPNCGGSPFACFGFCANGKACISPDGISCSCDGPLLGCGQQPNGMCGGACPSGQVCTQTVVTGPDGCPASYDCVCAAP